MKKCLLFFFLFLAAHEYSIAQTDTAFWFAAPNVDIANYPANGPYDRPIYLRLTSFTTSANVTVSVPANAAFTPINLTIPANSTSTIDLTPWIDLIENFEPGIINNKGIYIQSTADITAYYEVNSITCKCNPELFSLKGKNAIGNEFYIPSQVTWSIDTIRFPDARAAFEIVAIQNNTTITITPTKPLIGRPANVPFTITLNRGQTYSCQALYRNGPSLLNGSKIVSDKPIGVTTKEDLLFSDGPCADLAGDQIVPTAIFGNEYAVIRGDLTLRDKAVITARQNNTNIYLNGSATIAATINAGQSHEIDITALPSLYITTNNPVSVFHYTGNGCEVGAAVIPKLNCTGSSSVSIVRSNIGNAIVLLVTKNGNQGNFLVNGVPGIITAADFSPLAGTGGNYVYSKKNLTGSMTLNTATTFSNTSGKFQLGFINGDPGGYMYGYFSDFKKNNVTNSQLEICRFDSAQLNATGGITYQWTPVTGLSNPNISNPKASPAVTTDYKVVITDIEGCVDSAFVKVIVNACSLTCTNWLYTPSLNSNARVGDLDISGNKLTVEVNFNRTAPVNPVGGYGFLVSKHTGPANVNYAMWPEGCTITTTNGQYFAQENCSFQLNKTYHVAMVYDGTSLKYYRNGFLHSQTPATGNLILNDLITTIGQNVPEGAPTVFPFIGNINEVRIWNVARSQVQIQSFMNSSLPGPTTQTGLQGYYIFDNLLNKQGNPAYNAVLNGAATINATNPDCAFSADSCTVTTSCTNWLYTPSTLSSVKVGNINITGNQVTIEANYNRIHPTTQYLIAAIDLVGKGSLGVGGSNGDQSYYLGSELAIVTTTDGYFGLLAPCESRMNKTYHAAMVYDGATLKYYRDGTLINQRNATGNLTLNNNVASIGLNEFSTILSDLSNFVGYINEVRIWNVARTQTQLQTYMNSPLPNPASQPGLLAYYSFDNLLNKQGNVAFNGSLYGSALINQTNPSCTFTPEPGTYAFAGPDTTYCSTNPVSHQLQGNGNGNFSWTPAVYLNNPGIPNPIATINTTTTFYLTVTGPTFCAVTDSVTIFVTPPPTILALADTTICKLSPLVLSTNSNATAFQWSPAGYVSNPTIQNPAFIGPNSQRLYVTGSNGQNCSAIDSVDVTVKPLPAVKTIEDAILCNTNSVTLTTTGAQTYSWNPATFLSNPNIASPVYTGNQSQTYIVTGTGVNGCNASDTVQVLVGIKPIINAIKSNDIDCAKRTANLLATGGINYNWTPVTGLNNPNIPDPVTTISSTQTYRVLVSDANGCSNTDSVTVFVKTSESLARYMPNAFTPNGDGLNDCYGLKNWMYIKKLEFRIFNRYGEQVFGTSDPGKCWDGRYKGKPAGQGSYVYYIKAETSCGTEEQKGNFMLLR